MVDDLSSLCLREHKPDDEAALEGVVCAVVGPMMTVSLSQRRFRLVPTRTEREPVEDDVDKRLEDVEEAKLCEHRGPPSVTSPGGLIKD